MSMITSYPFPGLTDSLPLLISATAGLFLILIGRRRRGPSLRSLAGLLDGLPRTRDVVDAGRLAGAILVRIAALKLQVPHANSREYRPSANTVDGYG